MLRAIHESVLYTLKIFAGKPTNTNQIKNDVYETICTVKKDGTLL